MLTKEQFDKAMFVVKVKAPNHLEDWIKDLTYEKYSEMDRIIEKREHHTGSCSCCLVDASHALYRVYNATVTENVDTGEYVNVESGDGDCWDECGVCEKSTLAERDDLDTLEGLIDEE